MSTTGRDERASLTRADSGIALELPGGAAVLPVSVAGCTALTQAVIAGMRERAGDAWHKAALDPAVATWRSAEGLATADDVSEAEIVSRLQAAIVTMTAQGLTPRPVGRSTAALLLLEAIASAETHHALVAGFEQRVAEARLEGLRELAYGAGHEINNPLANIAARAQALLVDERDPKRRRRLATIVDQAFRARDMIGGLMLFARPPKTEPAATDVAEVLRPVVEAVAARAAARGIHLDYNPTPSPLGIFVDAAQVGEAVRMLAINALEAVDDGGRVLLEAAALTSRARIVVADDGPGMDVETAARACDPFFSGREAGRGIGLGLPKARRLIEANGGSLAIESRPGRGTRCVVDLPAAATFQAVVN